MTRKKKTLSYSNYPMLHVTWKDATADTGWKGAEESLHTHTVLSVGWKIQENDKSIVLASDIGDNEGSTETNRRIAIPKDWVIEIKEL